MKFALLVLLFLLPLTSFADKPLVDETLTMDVWERYAPAAVVQEFKSFIKKKYNKNIEVVVNYVYSPNEFFDRVRANKTDIISPSHNLIQDSRYDFIAKELVLPVDKKVVTHLKSTETRFLENEFITKNKKLYGIPFASGAYSLLYRKAEFKTAPDTWDILWDPNFRGRYAISKDFYESNIYITALSLGIPAKKIADIEQLKTKKFEDRLKTLLKNAEYWQGVPQDNDVKNTILSTAWGFSHSIHNDEKKEWQFSFPKEGITMWTDYLLVTRAVNRSVFAKTLAMEWLNFALSPDFQRKVTIELLKCYSAVPKAYEIKPAMQPARAEKDFLLQKAIYWPVLDARTRNGMKLIYDRVTASIKDEGSLKK